MLSMLLVLTGCQLGLQTYSAFDDQTPTSPGDSGWVPDTDCETADGDGDGYSECDGDCDDTDSSAFPGAAPQDGPNACMIDMDGDGYGTDNPPNNVRAGTDCDDTDSSIHPDASEVPFDEVDQDCDGEDSGSIVTVVGDANVPINDYATATSNATVNGCAQIADVLIDVEILHSYINDLEITLLSPAGTSIVLHNRSGGSQANLIGTYGTSGGTLSPAQSLAPLIGTSANGQWRLSIYDGAISDTGRLVSWGLTLSCP